MIRLKMEYEVEHLFLVADLKVKEVGSFFNTLLFAHPPGVQALHEPFKVHKTP